MTWVKVFYQRVRELLFLHPHFLSQKSGIFQAVGFLFTGSSILTLLTPVKARHSQETGQIPQNYVTI
jgi:hypothetical protein